MFNKPLPRRTFLRGLGTVIALPMLEAMAPSSVLAASVTKKAPTRLAFFYVPNGVHMQDWTPTTEGHLSELPLILQPLANVKEYVNVLTGLTLDKARPNGDGAGDHARSGGAFLTACQARKTQGADIKAGVSVDQYTAKLLGKNTRFASLELGIERGAQAGNCDSGYSCAYSSNISWSSESTPVAKEVDPRLVFERLFASGSSAERSEVRDRRDRYQQSILDFALDDAKKLQNQLGYKDLQKLDEYLTAVREIEKRVQLAGQGQENIPNGLQAPSGIPNKYDEHVRLMLDMMALAFQTDLTRVSSFMYANEGSNRPYREINISDGHHDLSHHGYEAEKHEKLKTINRFHIQQFAYLLEKLKGMKEGEGNVLDNVMLVYGSGISDGNRHNHDDLPVLLVGKGGGTLESGRHLKYAKDTPMANLYLSLLDRLQVPAPNFGDSTGRLSKLS